MNSGRHTATQISTNPACWLGFASPISHTILQEERRDTMGHRTPAMTLDSLSHLPRSSAMQEFLGMVG
jgi:hypothetical protein